MKLRSQLTLQLNSELFDSLKDSVADLGGSPPPTLAISGHSYKRVDVFYTKTHYLLYYYKNAMGGCNADPYCGSV